MTDNLVQPRRNQQEAERFFRRLVQGQNGEPLWFATAKLRSNNSAHRTVMHFGEYVRIVFATGELDTTVKKRGSCLRVRSRLLAHE